MAASAARRSSVTPMSVEDVAKQAGNFEYNPQIPLRYWLRSADTIRKEAQIYEREGNDLQTYLLLFRHAILVLEKLSKHPEAKFPENRAALTIANAKVAQDLAKLEILKPRINDRYKQYLATVARREAQRKEWESQRSAQVDGTSLATDLSRLSIQGLRDSDTPLPGAKKTLEPETNRDLAIRIAHKEIKRRDHARRAGQQPDPYEELRPEKRTSGTRDTWEDSSRRQSDGNDDDLSRSIIDAGRLRDQSGSVPKGRKSADGKTFIPEPYHYPTVPQKSAYEVWGETAMKPLPPSASKEAPSKGILREPGAPRRPIPPQPPQRPPKDTNGGPMTSPPPLPDKVYNSDVSEHPSRSSTSSPLNSQNFTFKPSATLENGNPLRTVFLPPELRHQFLKIALPNTQRNLETCGMLCGTLISNALFISRLVIPDQESTSDTCEMLNESALFDYCDNEDLMVLGWIHTHPTQTCFMSSRDLHTHSGYQVMMPESIAIVCAPSRDPSWGIFRLTDPPGLKTILNCTQTGIFHPHAVDNIYTDAQKPGHVWELPGLEFQVVDLRGKS